MNITPGWPSPYTYTYTYIMCSSDSKSGNWYDNELQTAQISLYFTCEAHIPNNGAEKIAQITEIKANLNLDSLYLKVNCYLIIDIMCLNLLLNREKVHRIMSACRNILNLFLKVIEKRIF